MKQIPVPEQFFGFQPGAEGMMFNYAELTAYCEAVEEASDRVQMEYLEKTLDGNALAVLLISSPENLANREEYRKIVRQLADPRELSSEEIEVLAQKGKAVCACTLSLHAHEIGGTQMSPLLIYELATSEDAEIRQILDQVIFILFPTANPDGLDVNTDWNRRYRGTPYAEGWCVREYNRYASHGNNRDGMTLDLVETRCFSKFLYREWYANALLDFHHAPSNHNRLMLEPCCDPLREEISPLLVREIQHYGYGIACELEEKNFANVVTQFNDLYGEEFVTTNYFNLADSVKYHNIIGILFEAAHIPGAYGMYVSADDCSSKGKMPSMSNPHPWEGGWWSLNDIVQQDKQAVLAMLGQLARNKVQVLRNTAQKALKQTERGAKSAEQAFLIPAEQWDRSARRHLLEILQNQQIEMQIAEELISLDDGRVLEKGCVIVPLAQPNFAVASVLLRKRNVPDNRYSRRSDGTFLVGDLAASNVAEWMGVEVLPANRPVSARARAFVLPEEQNETLSVCNNDSYRQINEALCEGKTVVQKNGRFVMGSEDGIPVRLGKIAVLSVDLLGYDSWAFCNHTMDKFATGHRLLRGEEICRGALNEFDILLLPGYPKGALLREDKTDEKVAPENRIGMGQEGLAEIRKFLQRGGRVIGWGKTCEYLIDCLELPVELGAFGVPATEYFTGGSLLHAQAAEHPFTRGIPANFTLMNLNDPVLRPKSENGYTPFVRYPEKNVLVNGVLVGEEKIAGWDGAAVERVGAGEVVLYGFDPQFRSQADGVFKLLLNALYL